MIVLGIDPGSQITGYAFLQKDNKDQCIQVLEYGAIQAKTNDELILRLGEICKKLEARIQVYQPTVLAMEASFYALNVKTTLVLGHIRGAIMALGARYQMTFQEYSPRSIKQAVTGSGAASKERVAAMMQYHLRLAELPQPADASDALAVAWTYLSPPSLQTAIANRAQPAPQKSKKTAPAQGAIPNAKGTYANALPAGTDIQALLAQSKKRRKR